MKKYSLILFCLLFTATLSGKDTSLQVLTDDFLKAPSARRSQALICAACREKQVQGPIQSIAEALKGNLSDSKQKNYSASFFSSLTPLADTLFLLSLLSTSSSLPSVNDHEFVKWLFGNDERIAMFLDYFDPAHDNFEMTLNILHELYTCTAGNRTKSWPLMLAMALVWDRKPTHLHGQTGGKELPFEPELEERYDFFCRTLMAKNAPFPIEQLSISAICTIVDTPVPVSELIWAQSNVREKSPEKLYKSITYDNNRLNALRTNWDKGPYTLANIQKKGGICTDQAYFTVMVLRARGIPAIYLSGEGLRGRHAWVAYQKNRRNWDRDIGRYENQDFTTGQWRNPQTGLLFTDHLIPLLCDPTEVSSENASRCRALTRLSAVLSAMEQKNIAIHAAEEALKMDQTSIKAWQLLERLQPTPEKVMQVLEKESAAMSKFPDAMLSVRLRQAKCLQENGWDSDVEPLLRKLHLQLKKREDLLTELTYFRIDMAIKSNKPELARTIMEQYLKDQKKEGAKILDDLHVYLELTRKTGQTAQAADFIASFVKTYRRSMKKYSKNNPIIQDWDTKILEEAYRNNDDQVKLKRLRR